MKNKNDLVEFTNGKKYLGPERCFHQSFNSSTEKQLGWRQWWNKNQNHHSILNFNQDHQPKLKNFFKNQENTKNIYL